MKLIPYAHSNSGEVSMLQVAKMKSAMFSCWCVCVCVLKKLVQLETGNDMYEKYHIG